MELRLSFLPKVVDEQVLLFISAQSPPSVRGSMIDKHIIVFDLLKQQHSLRTDQLLNVMVS